MTRFALLLLLVLATLAGSPAAAERPALRDSALKDSPALMPLVRSGRLPPVEQRVPEVPKIMDMSRPWQRIGRHGGTLDVLMARSRDTRIIYAYSYARLLIYTPELKLEPDILERVEVEGNRRFTFHIRPGHRWSDGEPFTAEDFRYWWEDVLNHPEMRPMGPPTELLVEGEAPSFEVLGPLTVRYSWSRPNPAFLPSLADARAVDLLGPAHYLKRLHPRYADPAELEARVEASGRKGWPQLHNALDNARNHDNPELPTLQPWVPVTRPPAERFVFERNPYFHRVDPEGRQLPYIDRVSMMIADAKLIPAKAGAGEADLQARYLQFSNFPVLKVGEERNGFRTVLWQTGVGSRLALYPNLTHRDPVWRAVLRDPRFRRALSLAIDREEINQVIYFGLGRESNNTVTQRSHLWREGHQRAWTRFSLEEANRLMDEAGLPRGRDGIRKLPDGRPLDIVVETAGADTEETDVLQLIADHWRKLGVRLFPKTMQLDVLRNRIYAGETVMAIAVGLDNAVASADMSPAELAPVDQSEYQWPRWGQHFQTDGKSGEPVDLPEARRLLDLLKSWREAPDKAAREAIWHEMLAIHADQQFTIGLVNGTLQPVVIKNGLRNVPEDGTFNWEPGAHFGIYNPDTFWFEFGEPPSPPIQMSMLPDAAQLADADLVEYLGFDPEDPWFKEECGC